MKATCSPRYGDRAWISYKRPRKVDSPAVRPIRTSSSCITTYKRVNISLLLSNRRTDIPAAPHHEETPPFFNYPPIRRLIPFLNDLFVHPAADRLLVFFFPRVILFVRAEDKIASVSEDGSLSIGCVSIFPTADNIFHTSGYRPALSLQAMSNR